MFVLKTFIVQFLFNVFFFLNLQNIQIKYIKLLKVFKCFINVNKEEI